MRVERKGTGRGTRRRRLTMSIAALALLIAAWDLSRRPDEQLSAAALLGGIELYRGSLAPVAATLGARCRFEPTCSRYAEAVIRRHGALRGSWLTVRRLARCGPWTAVGTLDPPP